MAADVEGTLAAVAVILGAAFVANLGFRRFRVPDVLPLLGLGVVLGPWLGLVDVAFFHAIAPLVGTVAILVILFDGGLEIRFADLRRGAATGAALSVAVLLTTVLLCAGVALWLGLPLQHAILLGLVLAGAGIVIVIPLIQHLRVQDSSVTTVSIEAAFSDVLVIVGVYVLSAAIAYDRTDPAGIAAALVAALGVGTAAGLAAGFLWARVLGAGWLRGYEYVLTLAALFLTHVLAESAAGSGPIAVLGFGLVLGNSHRTRRFADASTLGATRTDEPVFGRALTGFQQETVFLVRAFFLVGLGITLDLGVLRDPTFLVAGAGLALAVVAARVVSVLAVVRPSAFPAWDRTCILLMFPRGLAAAALSQVPFAVYGIAGTEAFPAYAAVVIVLTNVLAGLLVWSVERDAVRGRLGGPGGGGGGTGGVPHRSA